MLPGESFCPEGSEYVGKGGYGVFKAELRPAEVDPSSEKIFSQKFFSLGLLHYIIQPKVAVTKNRHSIFCPNALRIK